MSSTPAQRKSIELVYCDDCPNVEPARQLLASILDDLGLPNAWREWNRAAVDTPQELRAFGSPTILVDGTDVAGPDSDEPETVTACRCRIYQGEAGRLSGIPRRQDVINALCR